MSRFETLPEIIPSVNSAFQAFYDSLLKDIRLSVFFDSEQQVKELIAKQKHHFSTSLELPIKEQKAIYTKLGEYHYDLRIPYIDFIKGTEILLEHFIRYAQSKDSSINAMDEIFEYFKLMKAHTAKGYLNRMLQEDKRDIEMFFEQTNLDSNTYLPKKVVLQKIDWLKNLLDCIGNKKHFEVNPNDSVFSQWYEKSEFLTLEKRRFFDDLEKRILLNTKNLFYFLEREEYLEILPLYTSLLSIYKLTLMMNNAMTIEYANKIIEDMKLDSLTQLFRKDMFKDLLKVELATAERNDDYTISVAYLDLDNFKRVNDEFGHYSGDKVIEKLGEVIRHNIRASDLGFRIGGDEFAIIFKKASKQDSTKVCKKIQLDFADTIFTFNEDTTFSVTVSVGICDYDKTSHLDNDSLLKAVDKNLYEAKSQGKNQVISH